MRSVTDIINSFKLYLNQYNSKLKDFKDFGNLYFLIKAFAALINESEQNLNNQLAQYNFNTATGLELDSLAVNYGIYRKEAEYATGYVLIRSPFNITLKEENILYNESQTLKFKILESKVVKSPSSASCSLIAATKFAAVVVIVAPSPTKIDRSLVLTRKSSKE